MSGTIPTCKSMHDAVLATFDDVCDVIDARSQDPELGMGTGDPPVTADLEFDASTMKSFFSDERGRFRAWARNIGVHLFPGNRASIEHRFREAPHIRSSVVQLLQNLEKSTNEALNLLRGNAPVALRDLDDLLVSSASETSTLSVEGQAVVGSPTKNEGIDEVAEMVGATEVVCDGKSDLQYVCSDISHSIGALYRLSILLRNPTATKPSKPHKYASIPVSHFQSHEHERLGEIFQHGNLPPFLVDRLVRANLMRRQIFTYERMHHAKITYESKPATAGSGKAVPEDKKQKQVATSIPDKLAPELPSQTLRSTFTRSIATPLSETTALVDPAQLHLQAALSTLPIPTLIIPPGLEGTENTLSEDGGSISGLSDASGGSHNAPPEDVESVSGWSDASGGTSILSSVPEAEGGRSLTAVLGFQMVFRLGEKPQYIECPLCFKMDLIASERQWKKHVLRDLQPYICTFKNCKLPGQLFATRSAWYTHETQYHRRQWRCSKESCDGIFDTQNLFVEHLEKCDPQSQRPSQLLLLQCERESQAEQQCPFCSATLSPSVVKSHLGRHLVEVAMFALPYAQLPGEDIEAQSSARAASEKVDCHSQHTQNSTGYNDPSSDDSLLSFDEDEYEDLPDAMDVSELNGRSWARSIMKAFQDFAASKPAIERFFPSGFGDDCVSHGISISTYVLQTTEACLENRQIAYDAAVLALYNIVILVGITDDVETSNLQLLRECLGILADLCASGGRHGIHALCFTNTGKSYSAVDRETALILLNENNQQQWRTQAQVGEPLMDLILKPLLFNSKEGLLRPFLVMLFTNQEVLTGSINKFRESIMHSVSEIVEGRTGNGPASLLFQFTTLGSLCGWTKAAILDNLVGDHSLNREYLGFGNLSGNNEITRLEIVRMLLDTLGFEEEKNETAKLLLDREAAESIDLSGQYEAALTTVPLKSKKDTKSMLLDGGADINMVDGHYGTALIAAALRGNNDTVSLLQDRGADVDIVAGYYGTALIAAALRGNNDTVSLLLDRGADVDIVAGYYGTALIAAALRGNNDTVSLLIDRGANVDIVAGYYGTALIAAAFKGNNDTVSLLLDRGADVDIVAGDYGTALIAAALKRNNDTSSLLLDRGADINMVDGHYGTALIAAALKGNNDTVSLLLDRGAEVHILAGDYGTALIAAALERNNDTVSLLLDRGADINMVAGYYGTALILAAFKGNNDTVSLLLDRGAGVDILAGHYKTALIAAAFKGNTDTASLLLDRGAEVDLVAGDYGRALIAATLEKNNDTVSLLLDRGADINMVDGHYGTALIAAALKGNNDTVSLLLDRGADIDMVAGEYATALIAAVCQYDIPTVTLLLNRGAYIDMVAGQYGKALIEAVLQGGNDAASLMVNRYRGALIADGKVNTLHGHRQCVTALCVAISHSGVKGDLASLLLGSGANVNTEIDDFGSLLGRAAFKGDTELVSNLLKIGADPTSVGGGYNTARGHYPTALDAARSGKSANPPLIALLSDILAVKYS